MPLTPSRIQARSRLLNIARKAGYFNGVNAWVNVPDSPTFEDLWTNKKLTVEALIYLINASGNWFILNRANHIQFMYFNNNLYFTLKFSDAVWHGLTIAWTPPASEWMHVVGEWDGTTFNMYVNGDLLIAWSISRDLYPQGKTGSIGIGASYDGTKMFLNGYISTVRIYNRALSYSEIQQNYSYPDNPLTNGLILWLDGNSLDCTNNIWRDKSLFGNNGTLYNVQCVNVVSTPTRTQTPVR